MVAETVEGATMSAEATTESAVCHSRHTEQIKLGWNKIQVILMSKKREETITAHLSPTRPQRRLGLQRILSALGASKTQFGVLVYPVANKGHQQFGVPVGVDRSAEIPPPSNFLS